MKMRVRMSERERYREPETENTSSVHQCEDTKSERARRESERARQRDSERAREREDGRVGEQESERAREQESERARVREREGERKNLSSTLWGQVGKRGREGTHRWPFVDTIPQRMRE